MSASSDTNYKLSIRYMWSSHRARFLALTKVRRVSVYVTTSHTCYPVTDRFRLVMSDRNKVQVGLTFPHTSGSSLPVAPVKLSIYFTLSPLPNEPLCVLERNFLVYN